ncbi:MAG: PAS domain-containing protein [Deltaproteobacteria bacterium]|nr:PAS domain-containing protein [Deltaproteobacteria bacterium]
MAILASSSRSNDPPVPKRAVEHIATHEILRGLARLHSLVVVSDFDGRIVWMSDDLGSACGRAVPHVGSPVGEVFAELRGTRARARLAEQVSTIQSHLRHHDVLRDMRLDLGCHNGVSRSLDLSAFRTQTQDGRWAVVSIIHPSEQSEEQYGVLRDERDALDRMLDCSPDAVLAIDRFGFISYASSAVSRVLGVAVDKLVGKPVGLLQQQSMEFVQLLAELERGSDVHGHELLVERPDGSETWVSVNARSQHDTGPRGISIVVFLRDASAEVAARNQLERANTELESYVHSVSHDLRTPLVSLLGFTRLLRQDYDHALDDTGRHFAHRIEQAARSMQALVEDLLELSRIGQKSEHRTLVDPRSVLLQLSAELKLRLDEMDAQLVLPEHPPLVLCDRTRLYQLFSNLVGNALQHMGPCEDRRIRVHVLTRPDHCEIVVEDRGQGIVKKDIERIFEVFHTSACGKGESTTTGMGLAIVRKIAETNGGRAWATSDPQQGARFHVTLPSRP